MNTTTKKNNSTSNTTKATTKKKTTKLTPFEQELLEVVKQINEYKLNAEANVVSIIYKEPDLLRESNLKLEEFHNNCWRVFFAIANDILTIEKKNTLDRTTVGFYLEKHKKLLAQYEEYGEYDTIEAAMTYVDVANFDGYIHDLRKNNCLIKLAKLGFPVKERLSEFQDMTLESIYNEYTAFLNDAFVNAENDIKSYNGFDGLHELIETADKGVGVGLPLYNANLLTKEIGGINLNGNIYGLGASSGIGKSTMAINYLFPSVVHFNEKVVFIINEQDQSNFRKEAILWTCTNILKEPIQKYKFRDGNFDEHTKELLHKAADWLEAKKDSHAITIIPLEKYSAKIACKIIKKYSSAFGVRLFVLDTLKESYDARDEVTWKSLERDLVDLYDTVKPTACNVGLFLTYQISKASGKVRHLSNSDIGQARSIVDVMSCNLMMRRPFEDEYTGEKRELHVFKKDGINGKTKIPVKLNKDKHYMITFICKNRFGATDEYAIVSECDLSINSYHDIGYCVVPEDWN